MDNQAWAVILGGVAAILTGIAKYIDSRGKAQIAKLNNELARIKNEGEQFRSEADQESELIKALTASVDRFDKLSDRFGRVEQVTVSGFESTKTLIEDVRQDFDGWNLEIRQLVMKTGEETVSRMLADNTETRETLEASRHQEFQDFANEFAMMILIQQRVRSIDKKVFTLPTPDHPGWTHKFARPSGNRTRIPFFNAPWIDDKSLIAGVEIGIEGELVHVIEDWIYGWHVIALIQNGRPHPRIGYVPKDAVTLSEAPEGTHHD